MLRSLDNLLDDVEAAGLRLLAAHWLTLFRRERRLPRLREIDPAAFGPTLKHVWIVDADMDGRFRMRLSGEALAEWYGFYPKGRSFEELFSAEMLPLLNTMAQRITGTPSATCHRMRTAMPDHSEPAAFERLALPLCDDTGVVRHLFGATVFDGHFYNGNGGLRTEMEREYWYEIPAVRAVMAEPRPRQCSAR